MTRIEEGCPRWLPCTHQAAQMEAQSLGPRCGSLERPPTASVLDRMARVPLVSILDPSKGPSTMVRAQRRLRPPRGDLDLQVGTLGLPQGPPGLQQPDPLNS